MNVTGRGCERNVRYDHEDRTHLALRRKGRQVTVEKVNNATYIYRPSVDLLMSTTAAVYESSAVGLILTGMGSDDSLVG